MTDAYAIRAYPALRSAYTVTPGRAIRYAIMHATGGVKAGDLWTLSGRDKTHLVSCHYWIGKDGEIVQLVADKDVAWHVGVSQWETDADLNRYSIGVELENLQDGRDPFPEPQLAAAVWLVRAKVAQYRIPQSRLLRHSTVALPPGRKRDPGPLLDWLAFVAAVYPPPARRVVPLAETWVRSGPSTKAPIAHWQGGTWDGEPIVLPKGQPVDVLGVVTGQRWMATSGALKGISSDQWWHIAAGGFVWAPQVQEAGG